MHGPENLLRVYPAASPRAACVIGHGAGAGQGSPFLVQFGRGMAERGVTAATFDFPYIAEGRKVPDRPAVLEARWLEIVRQARAEFEPLPLFIGGKSLGGRIASHIAAEGCPGLAGLFFLGYPLHPPGNPEKRRDAHLPQIKEPMLFVQGSRDPFGTSDEIAALLPSLPRATLHVVSDGDHSFSVRASSGRRTAEVLASLPDVVLAWMDAEMG